jgi:uncharacterized UPF0160 family protein
MTKPWKIITHDGQFHADEVLAIALISEMLGNIPVERTRTISQEDRDNPEIWIIDVGGEFDPFRGLFDHHHDPKLSASCVLILNHLMYVDVIDIHLHAELENNFRVVSDIDTNGPSIYTGWQVNSLIKSFNSLEGGFGLAWTTMQNYIAYARDTVEKTHSSQKIWDNAEEISLHIKYVEEFPIHWKRYEEHPFLIYKDGDKYKVLSRDSDEFPIVGTGKEEFLHNARFIAVFSNKEDAVECAVKSEFNIYG